MMTVSERRGAPKLLLAIEAGTRSVSTALFRDGTPVGSDFLYEPDRHHSEILMPMIDGLFKNAGSSVRELDAIAVTRGPGSFTSVRIALATALGLAYPKRLPVHALTTLEVLAAGADSGEAWLLPLLDARKGEVYGALYRPGPPLEAPVLAPQAAAAREWAERALKSAQAPVLAFGLGARAYERELNEVLGGSLLIADESIDHPKAEALGKRVLARIDAGLSCEPATPAYLRQPEAVVKLMEKKGDSGQ